MGNQPPSISSTRRQLIVAGLPFCSLHATTQHLQAMHFPMSTWKRYCSPGAGARFGMRASCVGPVRAMAGEPPRLVSAKVTPSSLTRVSSGSDDIQTTPRKSRLQRSCVPHQTRREHESSSWSAGSTQVRLIPDATAGARRTLVLTWNERDASWTGPVRLANGRARPGAHLSRRYTRGSFTTRGDEATAMLPVCSNQTFTC